MAYWLVKSEPDVWSWDDHMAKGVEGWDGVRNHQAANNLKAMQPGDRAFFYHSNKGKEIVGILEVVGPYRPDPSDPSGRFGLVDMRAERPLQRPVPLSEIKQDPALQDLALVRQSRLSVMPISADHWAHLCRLGGVAP
jgi:predicted RNA-binding protein with PUA-like domain